MHISAAGLARAVLMACRWALCMLPFDWLTIRALCVSESLKQAREKETDVQMHKLDGNADRVEISSVASSERDAEFEMGERRRVVWSVDEWRIAMLHVQGPWKRTECGRQTLGGAGGPYL
ncbi:hypothetical protein BD289DRAFT_450657 [Coniella lustricola]|uniref:Secreted protein n=1 Tax=Coniella lustricola TaxID=2025994 RepID=A0A2T3AI42_9PEZI|nr:hypothetical protein BD289DRAFT_450657 [Coniella lustricola]